MFEQIATGSGLDLVIQVQSVDHEILNFLAEALHWMGGSGFFMLVIPLFYWSVNKQVGIRIIMALIITAIVNGLIKAVFQEPRPYQVSEAVLPLFEQEGYGFPSGHVMNAVVVWGMVALYYERRWMLVAVLIYSLLVAWSRMYGGVHYLHDLLGAFVAGGLLLALLHSVEDTLEFMLRRLPLRAAVALVFLAGFWTLILMIDEDSVFRITGFFWGAGAGLIIEGQVIHFDTRGETRQRVLRYGLGVLISLAFLGLMILLGDTLNAPREADVLIYGLAGLMGLAGWPWLAIHFGLMQTKTSESEMPPVDLWRTNPNQP